jgi:hypothetical protein
MSFLQKTSWQARDDGGEEGVHSASAGAGSAG